MIAVRCDVRSCGQPLFKHGALLFSPPDENARSLKLHICQSCYSNILGAFFDGRSPDHTEPPP